MNALNFSDSLTQTVDINAKGSKFICAHSLGNMVVSNAIENHGLGVSQYYMLNCAVPIEAYDSNQEFGSQGTNDEAFVTSIPMDLRMTEDLWKPFHPDQEGSGELVETDKIDRTRLFASNWHELFRIAPEDPRNQIKWKDRFASSVPSLAYNFYSTGEEVLENPNKSESMLGSAWQTAIELAQEYTGIGEGLSAQYAWINQELAKGAGIVDFNFAFGDNQAGWEFNDAWFKLEPVAGSVDTRPYTPLETDSIWSYELINPLIGIEKS